MLRTTISRIKKVCSGTLVPRVLRGDHYAASVSYAEIQKIYKSTKSTDDGKKANTDKLNNAPDVTFDVTNFKKKNHENDDATEDFQTSRERFETMISPGIPLTHRERCQRIIDQAFGKSDLTNSKREPAEQYYSHTVNIEDTRRKINESEKEKLKLQEQVKIDNPLLPEDRTQYGIFKMSREFVIEDSQTNDDSDVNAPSKTLYPQFTDKDDTVKPLNTCQMTSENEPKLTNIEENVDKSFENPESVENKVHNIDAETIEMVKDENKHEKVTLTAKHNEPEFLNAAVVKEDDTMNLADKPVAPSFLEATTAKEENEQLTQKLEIIEETPMVEAHKPKLEGFNVTPKVLGDQTTLSCKNTDAGKDNSTRVDLPNSKYDLDDMAKRCMDSPVGQIDELLLNEMDKLGVSMTSKTENKATSEQLLGDDLYQMDVFAGQPNTITEKPEINSESTKFKKIDDDSSNMNLTEANNSFSSIPHIRIETRLPDLNERADENTLKSSKAEISGMLYPNPIQTELRPHCDPNFADEYNKKQVLITDNKDKTQKATNLSEAKLLEIAPASKVTVKTPPSKKPSSHSHVNEQMSVSFSEDAPVNEKNYQNFINQENVNPFSTGDQLLKDSEKPPKDASVISNERLLKPEYNKYIQGACKPSNYGPMYASNHAKNPLAGETETGSKSYHSRNFNAAFLDSPSKDTQRKYFKETERLFRKVPSNKYHLPEYNRDSNVLHLPDPDRTIRPNLNKFYSNKLSKPKSDQKPVRINLPEELLKQHKLDPYYVLTCNETCPISPATTSTSLNKDLVDTTETVFLTNNNCESVQSKCKPKDLIMECESMPAETLSQSSNADKEIVPDITPMTECAGPSEVKCTATSKVKFTAMPEVKSTVMPEEESTTTSEVICPTTPEIKCTTTPEVKCTTTPEVKCTTTPEVKFTAMPKAKFTPEVGRITAPEVKCTVTPEAKCITAPEDKRTATPDIKLSSLRLIKSTAMPEIKSTSLRMIKSTDMPEIKSADMAEIKSTSPRMIKSTVMPEIKPTPLHLIKSMTMPDNNTSSLRMNKFTVMPEIKPTAMSEIKSTAEPEVKNTNMLDVKFTAIPDLKSTAIPDLKSTAMTEIKSTAEPEIKNTDMLDDKFTAISDLKSTAMPEVESTAMPKVKSTAMSASIESMPLYDENLSMSELLKRVRERNRLQSNNNLKALAPQVEPAEGKCNRKAPRCLPTAPRSPPLNPVPPPSFGLPMLKRRPPVCKPRKKPSDTTKCSACDMFEVSCGVELNETELCAVRSKVDLTDVVLDRLQTIGKILSGVLQQMKSHVETVLSRDYEPWSPIPSWPIPRKVEKKDPQPGMHGVPPCVEGCPVFPKASASLNPGPPCTLKPCEGFPKRRSFSSLDCFAVSLGTNKVYDLGEF